MPSPHREHLDERIARLIREQREAVIRASSSVNRPQIAAYFAYEDWFDGDGPDEHPQPGEQHQPAFEEPYVNTTGDDRIWKDNDDDRYWLRVPQDGLWQVSVTTFTAISLILGGSGVGYHGLELWTDVQQVRSLPPGDEFPVGRVEPWGFTGSYNYADGTQDMRYLPEGRTDFNLGYTFSGPPMELIEADSIRATFRCIPADPFDVDDGLFMITFQGNLFMERIGPLPA